MTTVRGNIGYEIDDTRDEFGCIRAEVFVYDPVQITLKGIGKSRELSKALAYALESLAERLKLSTK